MTDAAWQRVVATPNGSALAHARAAWLHRWSRNARLVLGLRLDQRGFTPVSGIIVANHTSLLDAILLAVQRRLLVVIFPECRGTDGTTLRAFTSALFQPAAELGCTLTAAAINYRVESDRAHSTPLFSQKTRGLSQLTHLLSRCRASAVVAFSAPTFRRGDRKQLARQLRGEVLDLKLRAA